MKKYFKKSLTDNPKMRKTAGIILVIIGLLSIITPFTSLGFFLILGLGLLGIKTLFWDKLKNWFKK